MLGAGSYRERARAALEEEVGVAGKVSRRAFLGTAGAATLVAVPRPRFADADESTSASEHHSVDVAVIGPTLTGLVTAHELEQQGLRVIVLGQRRAPSDLSDGWLTSEHVRLERLARATGALRELPGAGELREGWGDGTRPVPDGAWAADGRAASEIASALTKLDRMAGEVDLDAPWSAVNAPVRDARTLGSWLDDSVAGDVARQRLDVGFELALGAPPAEVSLLFALITIAAASGTEQLLGSVYRPTHVLDGGSARLAQSLTASLGSTVRDCSVVEVAVENSGVAIRGTDRGTDCIVDARRVVVAGEPEAAAIAPTVPRPFMRASVTVARCTYLDSPLFRGDLSGHVLGDGRPVHVVHPTADGRALDAVVSGSAARAWLNQPEDDRRTAVLDSLSRWLGSDAADPVRYEEFPGPHPARVVGPPGAITSLGPDLRGSSETLSWAGPETAMSWLGHAEGLVEAGQTTAAEVAAGLGT